MPVTAFSSADDGTNKTGYAGIKGVTGDLIKVLNSTLILDTGFTETGAAFFADQTNAWIQMGAGAALFVANNATTDRAYFGGRQKFSQLICKFATRGIGGTVTFEYWNGSAWTAFSPTDGTTNLTADGTISWTASSLTGWAQTAVNSIMLYWIRIKWATAYSQNPVLNLGSIYGWGSPFQGTNGAVYRSQLTSGIQFDLNVNDNGPGLSTGQEARVFGAERVTAYNPTPNGGTGITGPFPTVAQATNGWFVRKSADATTVRRWRMFMDEKTFTLVIITGDSTVQNHVAIHFGEFYSLENGDAYRCVLAARGFEANANIIGNFGSLYPLCNRYALNNVAANTASSMTWPRGFLGTGTAALVALCTGLPGAVAQLTTTYVGNVGLFNQPDGGIVVAPIIMIDTQLPSTNMRGRLRGVWDWGHVAGGVVDGDTFVGSGVLSTKTFQLVTPIAFRDSLGAATSAGSGVLVFETSNTWETN